MRRRYTFSMAAERSRVGEPVRQVHIGLPSAEVGPELRPVHQASRWNSPHWNCPHCSSLHWNSPHWNSQQMARLSTRSYECQCMHAL